METLAQNIFENLTGKTWHEEAGLCGYAFVFVTDDMGQQIAFRQQLGSGLPVIGTIVYDVEVNQDTLLLHEKYTGKASDDLKTDSLIFYNTKGLWRNGKQLAVMYSKPQLQVFTNKNGAVGESISITDITKFDLDKGSVYVGDNVYYVSPVRKGKGD